MALMSHVDGAPEPTGFDWSAATVGASISLVAAFVARKVLGRR